MLARELLCSNEPSSLLSTSQVRLLLLEAGQPELALSNLVSQNESSGLLLCLQLRVCFASRMTYTHWSRPPMLQSFVGEERSLPPPRSSDTMLSKVALT